MNQRKCPACSGFTLKITRMIRTSTDGVVLRVRACGKCGHTQESVESFHAVAHPYAARPGLGVRRQQAIGRAARPSAPVKQSHPGDWMAQRDAKLKQEEHLGKPSVVRAPKRFAAVPLLIDESCETCHKPFGQDRVRSLDPMVCMKCDLMASEKNMAVLGRSI